MAQLSYPATLPAPHEIDMAPTERRRLSDVPGVLSAAGKWRDFGGEQALRWVFSRAEMTLFQDWVRDDLQDGGAWFSSDWRQPNGLAGGVRRFVSPPTYSHISQDGAGLWNVEATVEIRGVPGVTSAVPLIYTGTVLRDVAIPNIGAGGNWASVCDIYIPDDVAIDSVGIWLHGGKGSKESFARNLGIVTGKDDLGEPIIKWEILFKGACIAVIPMGQFCAGVFDATWNPNSADTTAGGTKPGVRTWSNGFMYSGQNDPQMLEDLATKLATDYPGKPINLSGHSNGGFMTQRMALERPALFNRFAVASGPLSFVFAGSPTPTAANLKPMLSLIGGQDATLSVSGGPNGPGDHFKDATWKQPSSGYSVANVQTPPGFYIGEYAQFGRRAALWGPFNGSDVNPKDSSYIFSKRIQIKQGYQTSYFTSDQYQVLLLIEDAGHFILGRPDLGGPSMQECMGKRFFNVAMWFFNRP